MRRGRRCFRKRCTGLDTEEVIVVVAKHGRIQVEVGAYQGSVPCFVANQVFRGELSVADDPEKGQGCRCQQCGELKVFLDTGGCAHGTSDRGPYGLPLARCPKEPRGWLDLEAAIVVM